MYILVPSFPLQSPFPVTLSIGAARTMAPAGSLSAWATAAGERAAHRRFVLHLPRNSPSSFLFFFC